MQGVIAPLQRLESTGPERAGGIVTETKETRHSAMLCVFGHPLSVEFTLEKLHYCFDLIKAKYWPIVRHLAG